MTVLTAAERGVLVLISPPDALLADLSSVGIGLVGSSTEFALLDPRLAVRDPKVPGRLVGGIFPLLIDRNTFNALKEKEWIQHVRGPEYQITDTGRAMIRQEE